MRKPSASAAKFIGLVALGNLLLAIFGFARELLLASSSGTSMKADAFIVSFFIPDFLGNQLLATALLATCIPMFSGMSPEDMPDAIGRSLGQVVKLTVPLALGIALAAPYLVGLVAPGLGAEGRRLATSLVSLTASVAMAFPLASVMISSLHVRSRFAVAAMAPVAFNASLVLGHLTLQRQLGVGSWAVGACVGSVVLVAILWVAVRREYGCIRVCVQTAHERHARNYPSVIRLAAPLLLVTAVSQAFALVEKLFSSSLPEGGIAGLGYAYKVSQAPLWVGGIAVATVLFPMLSVASNEEEFGKILLRGLLATTCLLAPAALLLFVASESATKLIFAHGAFEHKSIHIVAGAMRGYSVGLVPQGALYILARAAQARGAWRPLLRASTLGLVGVVAADFILVKPWGTLGIALGTSVGSAISAVCLWVLLSKKHPEPQVGKIGMSHALSVDVEEWYHGTSLRIPLAKRPLLESRVVGNTRRLLALFKDRGVRATFFVCGEVAVQHPELVAEIVSLGHEIGAHSFTHQRLTSLSREGCRDDILRGIEAVEGAAGVPVRLFRAPAWSIGESSAWVLELLAECGITTDSSMYPARTLIFGVKGVHDRPSVLELGGGQSITEFPPSVLDIKLAKVPIGGGIFLRLAPTWLTRRHLEKLGKAGFPGMVYVHPWEVDPAPPWLWCSPLALFTYRFGLGGTYKKLDELLACTTFTTLTECLNDLERKVIRVAELA